MSEDKQLDPVDDSKMSPKDRVALCDMEFVAAAQKAQEHGMVLTWKKTNHYRLVFPNGGVLNIIPQNCRLIADKKLPPCPFIRMNEEARWSLMSIVNGAIKALKRYYGSCSQESEQGK